MWGESVKRWLCFCLALCLCLLPTLAASGEPAIAQAPVETAELPAAEGGDSPDVPTEWGTGTIAGDLNDDLWVTSTDLTLLVKYLLGYEPKALTNNPDINGDRQVNLADCLTLLRILTSK